MINELMKNPKLYIQRDDGKMVCIGDTKSVIITGLHNESQLLEIDIEYNIGIDYGAIDTIHKVSNPMLSMCKNIGYSHYQKQLRMYLDMLGTDKEPTPKSKEVRCNTDYGYGSDSLSYMISGIMPDFSQVEPRLINIKGREAKGIMEELHSFYGDEFQVTGITELNDKDIQRFDDLILKAGIRHTNRDVIRPVDTKLRDNSTLNMLYFKKGTYLFKEDSNHLPSVGALAFMRYLEILLDKGEDKTMEYKSLADKLGIKSVFVNEKQGRVRVILLDGREGSSTCSTEDVFDVVVGISVAFTEACVSEVGQSKTKTKQGFERWVDMHIDKKDGKYKGGYNNPKVSL